MTRIRTYDYFKIKILENFDIGFSECSKKKNILKTFVKYIIGISRSEERRKSGKLKDTLVNNE